MSALVVGLGRSDRGDDAVGLVVARRLAPLSRSGSLGDTRVVETEDPAGLLDLWPGHELVVVVDAVRSGAPPGTLHRLDTGAPHPALAPSAWRATGRGGTHALGLAAVLELARALHRLPARLVLVGVEAAGFDHGAELSQAVSSAVGPAVAVITAMLGGEDAGWSEGVTVDVSGRAR